MNTSSDQKPISAESPSPVEKISNKSKKLLFLYILLSVGVTILIVGIALVFLTK